MEIRYYNECVKHALAYKGLAAEKFEETDLRVFHRYDFHPQAIYSAVGKGGIIMPILNIQFFDKQSSGYTYTLILRVNRATAKIELYNPLEAKDQEYELDTFIKQWIADGSDCVTAFPPDKLTYIPYPKDYSGISIPEELMALREVMAGNAHDVWALERESEGWTYGYERDDYKLETPDLVPYAQLPESEKQYDRIMAEDTLKMLIALGYKIEKNG